MAGRIVTLSEFYENFPIDLYHRKRGSSYEVWVFGSQSRNNSSSAQMIYEKIICAFSKVKHYDLLIAQLWAPATIGGRRRLSTSGQPFAVSHLHKDLKKYRLYSAEYQYNIDVNNQLDMNEEEDAMILSGGPAAAFLNRLPEMINTRLQLGSPLARYASECRLMTSFMLPICSSFHTSSCVGVVECCLHWSYDLRILKEMNKALEEVGLSMFQVQERIPYKTINGLKPMKDEIEAAVKIICLSHNIPLAQVWIAYEDENHVPFSSSLEDTRMKQILALKLTGYVVDEDSICLIENLKEYYNTCDMVCLKAGEELVEKTLEDCKPRFCKYISSLSDDLLMACSSEEYVESSGLAICLRSMDTGDYKYAFEFIWHHSSNYVILLEALLLTLKRCLPHFKFASGIELGDELHVFYVESCTDEEINTFKIFQGKRSLPMPKPVVKGKKPMVQDSIAPLVEMKCRTAPIPLPREVIEKQFGNTMKQAAQNLNVGLSTLKRKCKDFGISEWQGPNVLKRKVTEQCNNQINRNEEDSGAIQEPLVVNRNENTLTIKAERAGDMIKFNLHISQATFVTLEKEIGIKFNLTLGSYKLKYCDGDGDWILLSSDHDMSYCVKSSRNLGRYVVRLRVTPSTE